MPKTKKQNTKPGYKKTKLGWIPNDWEVKRLNKLASLKFSDVDKKIKTDEKEVYLCNYLDVYRNTFIDNSLSFMKATATQDEIEKFKLVKGDLVITKDSEDPTDIAKPALIVENLDNVICGYHLAIIKPKDYLLKSSFLLYLFTETRYRHEFYRIANGITRFGLSNSAINRIKVHLPPLPEQQKIAQILSAWDRAIEIQTKLIEKYELRKKALMQQLLTGKKRFKEFSKKSKWKEVKLEDVFTERKETNGNDLKLLAITSSEGVVNRDSVEKIDTSSEDKSKYKKILPGDIGYNTMRLWQGVAGLSNLKGIVSPAYTVVIPDETVSGKFMSYLFKLPKVINEFYRHSQGLVSDTLNCKFPHFAQVKVSIPQLKEQQKIANVLEAADSEIKVMKETLEKLKEQKKGLMQQLLTGKTRVKVKEEE